MRSAQGSACTNDLGLERRDAPRLPLRLTSRRHHEKESLPGTTKDFEVMFQVEESGQAPRVEEW